MKRIFCAFTLTGIPTHAAPTVHQHLLSHMSEAYDVSVFATATANLDRPNVHLIADRGRVRNLWTLLSSLRHSDIIWWIVGDPKMIFVYWCARLINCRVKFVCTVHGGYEVRILEGGKNASWKNRLLTQLSLRIGIGLMLPRTSDIVFVSEYAKKDFEKFVPHLLHRSRLHVITNGIDETQFYPEAKPRNYSASVGFPAIQPLIVFVGRLAPNKRPWIIPTIAQKVPQANFLIITPEKNQLAPEEMPNLHYRLAPTRKEMRDLLANADAFLYPTIFEGFSLALAEAMGSGLPIFGSASGTIPEVVEDQKTGFLIPVTDHETEEFAGAIHRFLGSPELQIAMRAASVRRCREKFTWAILAKSYERIFRGAEKI